MGYIRHHAIIVIDHGYSDGIERAHREAVAIFTDTELVSPVITSACNGYRSFYVAPDGSKEGWAQSADGDERREVLTCWLDENRESLGYVDYVVVEGFGGDDNEPRIARHSGKDEVDG